MKEGKMRANIKQRTGDERRPTQPPPSPDEPTWVAIATKEDMERLAERVNLLEERNLSETDRLDLIHEWRKRALKAEQHIDKVNKSNAQFELDLIKAEQDLVLWEKRGYRAEQKIINLKSKNRTAMGRLKDCLDYMERKP